jgi:hypothetical protein
MTELEQNEIEEKLKPCSCEARMLIKTSLYLADKIISIRPELTYFEALQIATQIMQINRKGK